MAQRRRSRRVRSYSTRSYLIATLLTVTVFVTFLGAYFAVLDSHRATRDAGRESRFQAALAATSIGDAVSESLSSLTAQVTDPTTIGLVKQLISDQATCGATATSGGFGAFP